MESRAGFFSWLIYRSVFFKGGHEPRKTLSHRIFKNVVLDTPPKTNMEPEHDLFENREIIFHPPPFSGSMLVFGGVYMLCILRIGWDFLQPIFVPSCYEVVSADLTIPMFQHQINLPPGKVG